MSQYVVTPTKTFTAGGAIAQFLRVKTSALLVVAGSTDNELGCMENASFASGDPVAVRLRTAQGTQKFVAVDAITRDNSVYAAAGGKVSASGTLLIGIALETTTADGDIFEVLRRQETSDSAAAGGTTGSAFLVDSDSATPKIELAAQTGGTGDFKATVKPPTTLTANRVFTLIGDAAANIVNEATAQTLTNKTLTSPIVNLASGTQLVTTDADNRTVTAAESGSTFVSTGSGGAGTFDLPAATKGLNYTFHVDAAQELRINPDGVETIGLPSTGVQGAGGKYLTANAVGEWVKLICVVAGVWTAEGFFGTWTAEA